MPRLLNLGEGHIEGWVGKKWHFGLKMDSTSGRLGLEVSTGGKKSQLWSPLF